MVSYDSKTRILHGVKSPQIYHPDASLGEVLLHHLSKTPNKVTQVSADDGVELTCQMMADMMTNFAKNMIKLGLKFGDVVGIVGRNVTYATPTIFGCYLLGCPTSPLDSLVSLSEIASTFRKTKPKIIFCDANVLEVVLEAVKILDLNVQLVSLTNKVDGFSNILEFFNDPGSEYEVPKNSLRATSTVATIQATTGTTGEPKLVLVSHAQLLHKLPTDNTNENVFGFCFSIYSWIICTNQTVNAVLSHEKRLITTSPFDAEVFFDLLAKFKITQFITAPGHYRLLMESPRYETADFSSIKCLGVGGWHAPEELRQHMKNKLFNATITAACGMTEIGGVLCCTNEQNLISSVVGKPIENTQVKILMDNGSFGSINDIGEVLVKRPDRFLGYYNNPEATRKTIDDDGWLYTGDIGFIDNDLNVTLIGRKEFIIRQMNRMIQPSELEDLIEKIEGVRAVCVVGVQQINKGELATAIVYKDPNSNVSEEMIHDAVKHLEDYKRLHGGVFFVQEIALTISGKVKRDVVTKAANELYANRHSTGTKST